MKQFVLAAAAAIVFTASAANAATVTVNIPEPLDPAGFEYFGTGDVSVTYEGVTFSQSIALSNGNFYNVGSAYGGALQPVLSSQQASVGVANIRITLPVDAFGITISFGTFDGNLVTFALSNGASFELDSSGGGYGVFEGFASGAQTAFNTVQLTASDFDLHIASISYETEVAVPTVPEPASWALMIGGLGLAGGTLRRRSARVAPRRA